MYITFEELPKAVSKLTEELAEIKALLMAQGNTSTQNGNPELLTVEDAAKFLSLSVATVYSLNSKGELPLMKRGKRCYFTKTGLLEYLQGGKQKSNPEIAALATKRTKK